VLARVVLAVVLVLVPSATLASADVCDETALIDEGVLEPAPVLVPATPQRVLAERPLDRPYVSPALAQVFRPPR